MECGAGLHQYILLDGHKAGGVHVPRVLKVTVDEVGSSTFDKIVALVAPEVIAESAHGVVGPASVLTTEGLVVLDNGEATLECLSVKEGVQGIPAR